MTDSFFNNMRLGRYAIQQRIGTGGMARVFSAHDTNLDRTVAVKVLHDHLADDETFKERFQREARFVASFNHPNIIQIYDFDVVDLGQQCIYYMVMPYVAGSTLKDVLENLKNDHKRLPRQQVFTIIAGLAQALGYAHERGMVHRDVKPGNILFNEQGQPILTDFGIARLVASSNLTQEGVTTGTPAYMSPEQVTGLPVDARSDIYALGVILFEMLAGRIPYIEENNISTMLQHIKAPVPRLSDFLDTAEPALDAVIYRALAKTPEDRYPSTADLLTDLKQAFDIDTGDSLPDTGQTPTPPLNRPSSTATTSLPQPTLILQRSPQGLLVIGLVVIGVLVAIALVGQSMMPSAATSAAAGSQSVPSMTGDEVFYFTTDFAAESDLNAMWLPDNAAQTNQEFTMDGVYRFTNLQPATAAASIFAPDYQYDTATITLEAALESDSGRSSGYGIIFNYQDDNHYNVFAVDGTGRYSIWVREAGNWRELRQLDENWTADPAVQPIGELNRLRVEVNTGQFNAYVNDTLVTSVTDTTLSGGAVGIYLATSRDNTATLLADYYSVVALEQPIPSMTADDEN